MPTTIIEDNYVLTNYTSSVEERQEIDPGNSVTSIKSQGTIQILASSTSNLDGGTVTITNFDGLQKVYIFDDDSDGNTGTLDGSGRIRVQISGTDKSGYAIQLKAAITSTAGHGNTITVSGPDGSDGRLHLTQGSPGPIGDRAITSDISSGHLSPSGFTGGVVGTTAYKDAITAPFIFSTRSTQNLRGQTVNARYRTFLGEDRT
jgi:hypothetical protein